MIVSGRRSTKFYRRNEEEVMKSIGFKPTINSGAGWVQKEDGENDFALCQLKSTDALSISIKQNDLHILEQHAAQSHKLPVFAFQFLNTGETWIAVKPEHISLLKSLVQNEITIDDLKNNEFVVDKEVRQEYNESIASKDIKRSLKAKQKYMEEKEKERRKEQEQWQKRSSTRKA